MQKDLAFVASESIGVSDSLVSHWGCLSTGIAQLIPMPLFF